jgi:hypothetical protein
MLILKIKILKKVVSMYFKVKKYFEKYYVPQSQTP